MSQKLVHVCLVQSHPVWGACEEYWFWLAARLNPELFQVSLIYPNCEALKVEFSKLPSRVNLLPQPLAYFQSLKSGLLPFYRQLITLKPDIIHCNDPGIVGMIAATIAQIPSRILTFHTPSQSFTYRPHARFLQRWVLHQNWEVIAIAPVNKLTLQSRYNLPSHKVHVIEYGLDRSKFEIDNTREAIRTEFQLMPDSIVLGCVALLKPQKNHSLLLNAFAGLPEKLRNKSHLLLVGEGKLRSSLEEQVQKLDIKNQVTFTGYRRDIPQLLQGMDIFVLSSDYEGLPFAVLESMAMGLPVVATAVDGVRDAIVSGETGLLVPPQEVEALQKAITDLISNSEQRKSMGKAGRDRFIGHYTVERMIAKIERLYYKLIRKSI